MSQMTLRQGIETTLLEEVPELKGDRRHRPRWRGEPLLLLIGRDGCPTVRSS